MTASMAESPWPNLALPLASSLGRNQHQHHTEERVGAGAQKRWKI
uniref:Uncharacterized protein n=1 Tax=Fagus sylvatica TaxID=28930 RepID=A0A2N9IKK4_FAGSY